MLDNGQQNVSIELKLQCVKKEVSGEVNFLHASKHESLPQIDTMIMMGMIKHSKSSQNSKFAISLQYLRKEVSDEVELLHADKHQRVSYKLISTLWASKMPTRWYYHSLLMGMINHFQSSKFAIFLQYLKKLGMQFIWCMQFPT